MSNLSLNLLLVFSTVIFVGATLIGGFCCFKLINIKQLAVTETNQGLPWLFITKLEVERSRKRWQTVAFTNALPFTGQTNFDYAMFIKFFHDNDRKKITRFFNNSLDEDNSVCDCVQKLTVHLNTAQPKTFPCVLEIIGTNTNKKMLTVGFTNFINHQQGG